MFSHTINNPNNFLIQNHDFYAIPFGHRCSSALACKYAGIRKFSLPFDWTIPTFPSKIQQVLTNDFDDFIPDVHHNIFVNRYGIQLKHFNSNLDTGIEEYQRRINRFGDIIGQSDQKLYFIYINEDYLYDSDYREDCLNDAIFNEMLELEIFLQKNMSALITIFCILTLNPMRSLPNQTLLVSYCRALTYITSMIRLPTKIYVTIVGKYYRNCSTPDWC
ncbi:MAG: hypothetical protein HC795_13395 [Coleofasciculaceae cyanobacterium RL_1_1]|nr:hypothetical protein [Coleofasciculaceae cyanobacterium RL_1_1]